MKGYCKQNNTQSLMLVPFMRGIPAQPWSKNDPVFSWKDPSKLPAVFSGQKGGMILKAINKEQMHIEA